MVLRLCSFVFDEARMALAIGFEHHGPVFGQHGIFETALVDIVLDLLDAEGVGWPQDDLGVCQYASAS